MLAMSNPARRNFSGIEPGISAWAALRLALLASASGDPGFGNRRRDGDHVSGPAPQRRNKLQQQRGLHSVGSPSSSSSSFWSLWEEDRHQRTAAQHHALGNLSSITTTLSFFEAPRNQEGSEPGPLWNESSRHSSSAWSSDGDLVFVLPTANDSGAIFYNGTAASSAGSPAPGVGAEEPFGDVLAMGITSVILGLMILITVIGNVFVIAAILLERNLQSVANYLIVSLAVADLMVACLVMPLGAVYEISKGWILGPELCDMWTSSDVLCCTASILHLVAIAVDRYWAVTNVDYIHTRNSNRICAMIALVWSVALVVSLAPQFGWKDPDYLDRINIQRRCLVSQDVAYQIFATCSTFYVPLLVILVLYWKIFQTARKRIRRRTTGSKEAASKSAKRLSSCKKSSKKSLASSSSRRKAAAAAAAVAAAASSAAAEQTSTSTIGSIPAAGAAAMVLVEEGGGSEEVGEGDDKGDLGGKGKVKVGVTCREADVDEDDEEADDDEFGGGAEDCGPIGGDSAAHETTAFTINIAPSSMVTGIENHAIAATEIPPPAETGFSDQHRPLPTSAASKPSITGRSSSRRSEGGHSLAVPSTPTGAAPSGPPAIRDRGERREKKESLEAKRERKAAKTLAIITGAFVVCWLPFFIMALLMPLCDSCSINEHVASLFLWLGYFNSTLNPVIYTIFSPEFRNAFKRILCGRASARSSYRPRKLR